MHRSKYPLLHLRDLLHLVNKGMLDYVRDKTHQPQAQDFEMLKEIFAMGEQIKIVSIATTDTLRKRQQGKPEIDQTIGESE